MLVHPATNNYRLKPNSPCVNNGLNFDYMTAPADPFGRNLDLDCGPRIRHSAVDMGAYETRVPRGLFFSAE